MGNQNQKTTNDQVKSDSLKESDRQFQYHKDSIDIASTKISQSSHNLYQTIGSLKSNQSDGSSIKMPQNFMGNQKEFQDRFQQYDSTINIKNQNIENLKTKKNLINEEKKQNLKLEQRNNEEKNKKLKEKGDSLFNQADKHYKLHNLDEASKLFKECLQLRKQYPGPESVQYAQIIHKLGLIYKHTKKYDQALILYKESLNITQKTIGKTNQNYTKILNNIGNIYGIMIKNDLNRAMICYEEVLKIKQKTVGKQHPNYASTLESIGVIYDEKKQYVKALTNFENAKKIYQKTSGSKSFDYANVMNNIGATYQHLGKYETALECYSQCVKVMIKTNNQKHPDFETMKTNLKQMKKHCSKIHQLPQW